MERGSAWTKWAGYGCLVLLFTGCGSGGGETPAANSGTAPPPAASATATAAAPESVVQEFLEAVRTGDAERSASLLTDAARTETAKLELAVAPPGSETASYTVGKVEMVGDFAHVASTWTDIGDDGQPNSDNIIWVLRNEAGQWRIGGMATTVFPGEPPLLLDFEHPDDMLRKQQLVEEEYLRRQGLNPDGTPIDPSAVAGGDQAPATQQVQVPPTGDAIQR